MDPISQAAVRRARAALDILESADRHTPKFRVGRVIEAKAGGSRLDGFELEFQQELARQNGQRCFDVGGPFTIPWTAFLSRDLDVYGSAGYLSGTQTSPAALDLIGRYSVTAQSGLQLIPGATAAQTTPIIDADAVTVSWDGSASSTTPALKQVASGAKTGVALLQFSRRMVKQIDAEGFARNLLARVSGRVIDRAMLAGSGASGEPTGVPVFPGVATVSGTSLDLADVVGMKADVSLAGANDSSISFVGHPEVRELLEKRERASGSSGFIWDNDLLASRPAYATPDIASGTLICGAWSSAAAILFGPGVQIDVNPYAATLFAKGIVQVRLIVDLDTALNPAAFVVATSVT